MQHVAEVSSKTTRQDLYNQVYALHRTKILAYFPDRNVFLFVRRFQQHC